MTLMLKPLMLKCLCYLLVPLSSYLRFAPGRCGNVVYPTAVLLSCSFSPAVSSELHTHTHRRTHRHRHTHTDIHTHTHTYTERHTHTHTYKDRQTHTQTQNTDSLSHTRTHTHTHTHTHIHTCTLHHSCIDQSERVCIKTFPPALTYVSVYVGVCLWGFA